jgi:cellobiose phosphorylase
MANGYGHFSADGREYHVTTPQTPRPWLNYLWNESFLSVISQVGQGWAMWQGPEGHRVHLVTARMVYLLDGQTGELWSAGGLPAHLPCEAFRCTHGAGYSRIELTRNAVASSWRVFVPRALPCEVWTVTVRNLGDRPRKLEVVPFFDTGIEGWFTAATRAWHEPTLRAVLATSVVRTGSHYAHDTTGRRDQGFLMTDREPGGYDTRRSAFIGHYDTHLSPRALREGGCTCTDNEFEKAVLALEVSLELAPGEEKTIHAAAGVWHDASQLAALRDRLFADGGVEGEFDAVGEARQSATRSIEIDTPDTQWSLLFNHWLQHQLCLNATWARVYFNGFRDLCQDAANLAALDSSQALATLRRVLSHQYASGYAPRAWVGGELVEQGYSDSPVWVTFAVHALLEESGDVGILEQEVPFRDGAPATIYEHARRSLEYLWTDRGPHGLSKIHRGDWNDVMNGVGKAGRGESVWLSMALHLALRQFGQIASLRGDEQGARAASERAGELARAVDRHGWDGEFYLRAYTDDGLAVGSADSEEGMFLNPQVWAVLSGVAGAEKAAAAMRKVDELLETEAGISTLQRPFDGRFRPEIGFLSAMRPGVNVNGGIYLHANTFKVVADCLLKRNAAAWRTIEKMLPFSRYRKVPTGEPFVMPNAYYGPASGYHAGEAGDGWLTGTAGWLVTATASYLFGLRPTFEGLRVEPCLPPHWKTCSIRRFFRGATYHVRYQQRGDGPCNHVERVMVNGEEAAGTLLPNQRGGSFDVVVVLTPEAPD